MMMKRKEAISWHPVKKVVKKILDQYHPEAVKAEVIWDHVKTEMRDARLTKRTIYEILYHMNKEGEIERVSMGWYQLPGKEKKFTPDPAWKAGYDEGYKQGYKDAMAPMADLEKVKEKMLQIFFDELVLEVQKVRPDPERIQLLVEMMRDVMGGRRAC